MYSNSLLERELRLFSRPPLSSPEGHDDTPLINCNTSFGQSGLHSQLRNPRQSSLGPTEAFREVWLQLSEFRQPSVSQKSFLKKTGKRGKYRSYSDGLKAQAIRIFQESGDLRFVSRTLHVPMKNVERWVRFGIERKKGGQVSSWEETDE